MIKIEHIMQFLDPETGELFDRETKEEEDKTQEIVRLNKSAGEAD
jgi:hypothetical protein